MTAVQNGNRYHYFGGTRSVNNPAMPGNILTALIDAWADYFSVQPQEPPNQAESDQLEQLPHDEL